MASEFLSVVLCVIADWYYYFMQNLFISVIFQVPNFYPSDYFFVANKLMDFMQPPHWFSFQFQKSTKVNCTCFLKICHRTNILLFFTNSTFTTMLLLITRNEEVQGWGC
jgi:hypothetical protein